MSTTTPNIKSIRFTMISSVYNYATSASKFQKVGLKVEAWPQPELSDWMTRYLLKLQNFSRIGAKYFQVAMFVEFEIARNAGKTPGRERLRISSLLSGF
jgi:hypothetical protein